jgi:hypothetical protein
MRFSSDNQRKAVMAKLRKGSTIIYSYERKKNDINGNPRHYAYNISIIKKNEPVKLIEKIDIGYRDPDQAIFEELIRKGVIPKPKVTKSPPLPQDYEMRLRELIRDEEVPVEVRRQALKKLNASRDKTDYWDLKRSYNFRRI